MFTLIDEPYQQRYVSRRRKATTFPSTDEKNSLDESAIEIGERIKLFAKKIYGSQTAFAEAIGKSTGQVGDWVSGRRVPGGDVLKLFREVAKMSIDWLLTGEGEMLIKKPTGTDMSDAQDFDADRDMIIETIEDALARLRRMRSEESREEQEEQ